MKFIASKHVSQLAIGIAKNIMLSPIYDVTQPLNKDVKRKYK